MFGRKRILVSLFTILLLGGFSLFAIGCGGGGDGGSSIATAPSGMGVLVVNITDSPFSDASNLFVTISDIEAHKSGGDWFVVESGSKTFDLKTLVGVQQLLGSTALQPGHYTMLRLDVTSSTIVINGKSSPVKIPSSRIELNREFDIVAGKNTTLLLDFDGDKSVKQTGNGEYMMAPPVIAIVSSTTT